MNKDEVLRNVKIGVIAALALGVFCAVAIAASDMLADNEREKRLGLAISEVALDVAGAARSAGGLRIEYARSDNLAVGLYHVPADKMTDFADAARAAGTDYVGVSLHVPESGGLATVTYRMAPAHADAVVREASLQWPAAVASALIAALAAGIASFAVLPMLDWGGRWLRRRQADLSS